MHYVVMGGRFVAMENCFDFLNLYDNLNVNVLLLKSIQFKNTTDSKNEYNFIHFHSLVINGSNVIELTFNIFFVFYSTKGNVMECTNYIDHNNLDS